MESQKNQPKPLKMVTLVVLSSSFSFLFGVGLGLYLNFYTHEEESETLNNSFEISDENEEEISEEALQQDTNFESKQEEPNIVGEKRVERFKKMLRKNVETELSKDEFEELASYGISIGNYDNTEEAYKRTIEIYQKYPGYRGRIGTREIDDLYHVVIGSFLTKEEADKAFEELPKKSEFLKSKIIKL